MTASLFIPRAHVAALEALAQLPPADFEALTEVLAVAPGSLNRSEFERRVTEAVGAVVDVPVSDLVTAMLNAAVLLGRSHVGAEELASETARDEQLGLTPEQRDALGSRLEVLIGISAVTQTAKGFDLLLEHERVLHGARVITDIRPIFHEDRSKPPGAAVIVHQLKLDFHGADGFSSFYIALDTADLEELRGVLDDAALKADSLRNLLRGVLPVLEVEDDQ